MTEGTSPSQKRQRKCRLPAHLLSTEHPSKPRIRRACGMPCFLAGRPRVRELELMHKEGRDID